MLLLKFLRMKDKFWSASDRTTALYVSVLGLTAIPQETHKAVDVLVTKSYAVFCLAHFLAVTLQTRGHSSKG